MVQQSPGAVKSFVAEFAFLGASWRSKQREGKGLRVIFLVLARLRTTLEKKARTEL